MAVAQEAPAAWPTLRSHRIGIGLYDATADALLLRRRIEVDVAGALTPVPELVGEPAPDLLLLNDGDLTYAKIRFDERSRATVVARLRDLGDDLARALCWASCWDALRDAEITAEEYLRLVLDNAVGESDVAVLEELRRRAHQAVSTYGVPEAVAERLTRMAAAALRELRRAEPGGDRQLAWARWFVDAARSGEQVATLRGLLDGSAAIEGLAVDAELRWRIVRSLAALTPEADALIASELERDATDRGQRYAAEARAARPTAAAKEEAWRAIVEDGSQPLAMVRAQMNGFQQAGQVGLLAPYASRFFEALGPVWRERGLEVGLEVAQGLYPRLVVDERTVRATEAYLEAGVPAPPVRRILLEAKDDMERVLRARARDAAALASVAH